MLKLLFFCLISIVLSGHVYAQRQAKTITNRRQDTTRDAASGWYFAQSAKGYYSVLMPVPFDDITSCSIETDGSRSYSHSIRCRTVQGITLAAIETDITKKIFMDIAQYHVQSARRAEDVVESSTMGIHYLSFSTKFNNHCSLRKYVLTDKHFIMLCVFYPAAYKTEAGRLAEKFFNSLQIEK